MEIKDSYLVFFYMTSVDNIKIKRRTKYSQVIYAKRKNKDLAHLSDTVGLFANIYSKLNK